MNVLTQIFMFFGGFGLFLYGMNVMADGLQKTAGNKMKNLLGALTNNRFLGVIVGALITAIIQSSSATTVMVVGFVNAGLLNLTQAVGVIMGANIGTTITSWIVSMGDWAKFLKPTALAPLAIGIGSIMIFLAKGKKKKLIGEILVGFGILFIGLEYMSQAMHPLRESKMFKEAFLTLGKNPLLGVLIGTAVTAIIQSSSASVAILQQLSGAIFMPFNAAVYIILGQNIGTCVTALISSIGANKTAKRSACIHLLFNVIGTILIGVGIIIFFIVFPNIASLQTTKTNISIFHTIFNVGATLCLFPFAKHLVSLSEKIVRGEDDIVEDDKAIALRHLDERILETPSFAVENAIKEVVHLGNLAINNSKMAIEALLEKNDEKIQKVKTNEKNINMMEKLITDYLVKISNTPINEHQKMIINNLFHSVNDIERIGDHAENIAELAEYYLTNELTFSDVAKKEMEDITSKTIETIENAIKARELDDIDLVRKVIQSEEIIDSLEEELREKHIRRLSQNICNSTVGVVFLDTISNLERMSDHALNIAYYVKDELI